MRNLILFFFCLLPALIAQAKGMPRNDVQEKPFTVPAVKEWKPSGGTVPRSSLANVIAADNVLSDKASYLLGFLAPAPDSPGIRLDVRLSLCKDKELGEEGYRMTISNRGVNIQAQTGRGIMWGIQTLQQLCRQYKDIPCGTINDVPDYPLRGMMMDCGRKFIPMSYLYDLVDMLSYYKMNTLQVHLNDNGFKKHAHDNWDETYAAFRLESDFFPGLTARDGHYTKDEFRRFIRYAASVGVEIIPEFDAPAHSLAFTRYRPSLACEEYGQDHLDLRNPAVIPFLDSLYSEYLGGDDPVFCCPRMHIGTDEYSNKDSAVVEMFRSLADHLIRRVEGYGKQAVLWGSLTHANGRTPVKSDNVLMHMWYNGYANPDDMKAQGYHMISIPDGYVYIVPEAGYYYNYLNCRMLFDKWTPARIGDKLFEEQDPMIEGGMFAVWNDICGGGISVGDIHHRVYHAVQVIAEKTWRSYRTKGDSVDYSYWDSRRTRLGEGYRCHQLGTTELSVANLAPSTVIGGHEDAQIGYDYEVSFDIEWVLENPGTVLCEGPYARVFLSDPIGGWLGFARDGYLFTFNYKGRPGTREHISIKGDNSGTTLSVDGKEVQRLGRDKRFAADKSEYHIIRTLVFPLHHTGDFRSRITQFKATKL